MTLSLNRQLPLIASAILFVITTWFFWPGALMPDSAYQMKQAIAGFYLDQHPPLMAFYWRILLQVMDGPGLMFLTQQLLLWGAVAIFIKTLSGSSLRWLFLLIPFWPQIFRYEFFVLKDVQFTFSFLFVAAVLSYYSVNKQRPSWFMATLLLLILFYGTGVKYQAKFLLPIMTVWLSAVIWQSASRQKIVIRGMGIGLFLLLMVHGFNYAVTDQRDHMWQNVKLFDLAGMSLLQHKSLFPQFIEQENYFSMETLASLYTIRDLDRLLRSNGGLLRLGANNEERSELYAAWWRAVLTHPVTYATQRASMLTSILEMQVGRSFLEMANDPSISQKMGSILRTLHETGIERLLLLLLSFKIYFVLILCYLFVAFWYYQQSSFAAPVLFLNLLGMGLIVVLSVFSLATMPRYIYLTTCCFHFSHPFFFGLLRDVLRRRRQNAAAARAPSPLEFEVADC